MSKNHPIGRASGRASTPASVDSTESDDDASILRILQHKGTREAYLAMRGDPVASDLARQRVHDPAEAERRAVAMSRRILAKLRDLAARQPSGSTHFLRLTPFNAIPVRTRDPLALRLAASQGSPDGEHARPASDDLVTTMITPSGAPMFRVRPSDGTVFLAEGLAAVRAILIGDTRVAVSQDESGRSFVAEYGWIDMRHLLESVGLTFSSPT